VFEIEISLWTWAFIQDNGHETCSAHDPLTQNVALSSTQKQKPG